MKKIPSVDGIYSTLLNSRTLFYRRDGMPKPETKQELMSKAPLFGVDGEATR